MRAVAGGAATAVTGPPCIAHTARWALGYDFGAAPEARQAVPDVAVVLLDRERQVLAGEQLILRDHPVVAFPVVGDEGSASQADLVEEFAAGRIITPTQNPGHGSPDIQVIGAPNPER